MIGRVGKFIDGGGRSSDSQIIVGGSAAWVGPIIGGKSEATEPVRLVRGGEGALVGAGAAVGWAKLDAFTPGLQEAMQAHSGLRVAIGRQPRKLKGQTRGF